MNSTVKVMDVDVVDLHMLRLNGISFLLEALTKTAEHSSVKPQAIYALRDLLDSVVEDMKTDFRSEDEGRS